jgi:hypothetical protein
MKNFQLYELVPKETYEKMGEAAWYLFRPTALQMLDDLHDFFTEYKGEKIVISVNDWYWGGNRQYCGWRPEVVVDVDGHPIGAGHSWHKAGGAFDAHFKAYTAEEARQIILSHKDHPLLQKIMRLEDNVSWVHLDNKPGNPRIHIFS